MSNKKKNAEESMAKLGESAVTNDIFKPKYKLQVSFG